MANFSGAAQGYLDYTKQQADREKSAVLLKAFLEQQEQQKIQFGQQQDAVRRTQQARTGAGQAFLDQFGAPPVAISAPPGAPPGQPAPQPPMPGQAEGPSIPAPPQMPNPESPGPNVSAYAPPPGPPPAALSPNWQSLNDHLKGAPVQPQGAPGAIAPPPGQPAPATAPEAPKPGQLNATTLAAQWKKEGVPPDQILDRLDALTPFMSSQHKQELESAKLQLQVQTEARKFADDRLKQLMAERKDKRDDRRLDQADERADQTAERDRLRHEETQRRNDIAERRMSAALGRIAGAQENMKGVEYIYPKDPEGKPDQNQAPLGTRGTTKSGKIIYLDAEGNPTSAAAMAGGTAKEGKGAGAGGQAAVRANIVKQGVHNAINRLDEIEKTFGDTTTTSSFFGTHADNPLTKTVYGVGKGMQGKKQQEADAKWASFIDEAIPVFTGGLRGSDSFRKFLIEQAPGPGDRPETVAEKRRLFRENINGVRDTFFQKFKSDPAMHGAGVKAGEIQAQGGDAAPKPAAGQWKVEKVN